MSERPESAGFFVQLLVALAVVGLVFGGGVLVGWATRARKAKAPEGSAAVGPDPRELKRDLKACRRELRELLKPPPVAPAQGATDDAGVDLVARGEALRKEVQACRVRATVQNAYVCATIDGHVNLHGVLLTSSACVEEAGIPEFLVRIVDSCAEFQEAPAHLDEDELTQTDKNRIGYSQFIQAGHTKKNMVAIAQELRRRCRKEWALPEP